MTRFIRFCLLLMMILAVVRSVPSQAPGGVDILLAKARSLEARGRMDLAVQNWQQILLVNPNQTEALGGLARSAKENGQTDQERSYLDRLRKINPRDPEIAAVEKLRVFTPEERNRLDEAGRLNMQHKPDEAMKIYRKVLGDQPPPPGRWAGPYYETEAASSGGQQRAISQLRQLCARNPNYEAYRLWLASVLSYDPKTRMEGLHLFESIKDPGTVEQARAPWRQALVWEKDNPDVLAPMEAYVQRYPDTDLQPIVAALHAKQQQTIADATKEHGFQALRNKDTDTAAAEFNEVLRHSPNDANAIAGLGYVRLDQKRFREALSLFEQARTLAPERQDVREGYDNAKFWLAIERGATAQQQNQPETAIVAYQEALALRPSDNGALLGIANSLVKERKFPDAETRFQQVLKQFPNNADAMAGLGFVRLNQGKFDEAANLFAETRKLDPARKDVDEGYRNAKFWDFMNQAGAALNQHRQQDAVAGYQQALLLNPDAKDALLGLAHASERAGDYAGAARTYDRLTAANPDDDSVWLGLIQAQMEEKNPQAAISTSQRIPATAKQKLEARSDYLSQMALAFYSVNQTTEGDRTLRRAMETAANSDTEDALSMRLQVAGVFIDQGNPERAIEVYDQAAKSHPDNPSGWEGLVGVYTRMHDFPLAVAAVRSMPQRSYDAAVKHTGFLDSVAVLYSAQGKCGDAEDFLNRSLNLDQAEGHRPAEGTQLQLADIWMRENNYDRARQLYMEILTRNANSAEGWRGYMVALHQQRNDRTLVGEIPHVPSAVRTQLETDANFLILEASAHSTTGRTQDAVPLLQEARSRYTAQHKAPPVDLDIQLAWTMLTVSLDQPGLSEQLQNTKVRTDLTARQREAIEELWSTWSVRRAEHAFSEKPQAAFDILTDAGREYPKDRNIHAALASLYLKRHETEKALDVYRTWGMNGAQAGDYRVAAGVALSAHKNQLADQFLQQGREQFPNDPELLHMIARQDIGRGNYDEGERELKSALMAVHAQETSGFLPKGQVFTNTRENTEGLSPSTGSSLSTQKGAALALNSSQSAPPCRAETTRNASGDPRIQPIRLVLIRAAGRNSGGQLSTFLAQAAQAASDQNSSGQNSADQPPAGQNSGGQKPADQPLASQNSGGQNPADQRPPGQNSGGQNSSDKNSNGQAPARQSSGEQIAGNPDSGGQPPPQNPPQAQQIQDEIDTVENRNTPVISTGSFAAGRVGDPGFDRLIISDSLLGTAFAASNRVRFGIEAHGVYLFSGTPDGSSTLLFGTLPAKTAFDEQSAAGYTGMAQLSTENFGMAVGTTPQGFPVHNLTAGIRFRPLNKWFTFLGVRDSVKDSLLSYAGTRDPATGITWGGVVANTGTFQFESGSTNKIQYRAVNSYGSVSYSFLQGKNVPDNWDVAANAGVYWHMVRGLTMGVNVTGMHYDKNLNFFSFGQGGYFSPQQYYLGSIPISWYSRHRRFEYEIKASGGVQYLQQDASPFYPTQAGSAILTPGVYASNTSTAPNYNVDLRLGYRVAPRVYFDTFATANNARDYYTQSVGFNLRFMIDRIPTSTDLHVNSIPDWMGRQPFAIR